MTTIKLNSPDELPNNFTGIVEYSNGGKEWWIKGKLHRLDGPAVEYADGDKFWYVEGLLHRENGPAVEHVDGSKYWYKEGKFHRKDGPAIEYADGTKKWCIEGNCHREDGPAIEHPDGYKECWIDNKFYSYQILRKMFKTAVFLKVEKGKYDLNWLIFLTEKGIETFPLVPGMGFKKIYKKLIKVQKK